VKHATALGAAVVAGLGAIAGTVWVGSQVREETVVAQPYEEGLLYDRERHAREALGWAVEVGTAPPAGASAALDFTVRDRRGHPVDGAVTLTVGRPDTSRGQWRAEAAPTGGGAYRAELRFPAPGPWEVRFDVRRGAERARITRTVRVPEAGPGAGTACDLGAGPCTAPLAGGGEVSLELRPRPLRPMTDLEVTAEVREGGAPLAGAAVSVRFEMKGMQMFPAEARLAPAGPGRHAGRAVLVRCPSGRRDWTVTVQVTPPGGTPRTAELPLEVSE
jgi:FixH protein